MWKIEALQKPPQMALQRWSVRELAPHGAARDRTCHLVGWSRQDGQGHASSNLLRLDPSSGTALTSSGRLYQLSGPPGSDSEGEYVWSRWKAAAHLNADRDVTEELYADVVSARGTFLGEILRAGGASAVERLSAELERKAWALVWSGTEWLSTQQIRARTAGRGPSAERLADFEQSHCLFSLQGGGERRYGVYAFDRDFAPRPAIGEVMRILDPISACGLAAFFESTSSFLNGRRPRELLATDPEAVIAAAMHRREVEDFCG